METLVRPAGMTRRQTALALAVVGGEVGAAGSHNGSSHGDDITPDGGAGALVFGAHGTTDDAHQETEESELNTLKKNRSQELGITKETVWMPSP